MDTVAVFTRVVTNHTWARTTCTWLSNTVCGVVLLAGAASATAEANLFESHEFVTASAERQTVLAGFFRGAATAELAVVHTGDNGDRRLKMYGFEGGTWVSVLDTALQSGVLWVDVAEIGGRDRLITFEPGRLSWFDPAAGTQQPLVATTSNFSPPRGGEIPHVDVTQDLNGDGFDDLVIPDSNGFRVFIQLPEGKFADPVTIGSPADMSGIYGADGYRYDPWSRSRVYQVDHNHDGRTDLVFWREDRFQVHHQDANGMFEPQAAAFTTDVVFDSDDLDSLAIGAMAGKVLHSMTDLNGDRVPDLVVFTLDGERIKRKRSAYEMHYGTPGPQGGTVWMIQPDAVIGSSGSIQLGMKQHDFDGDGQPDLMFTTIDTVYLTGSLWKRLKGYMGDDIWLELALHKIDGGVIRDTPDAIRRIQLHNTRSIREPGWVPLDVVLRGATHESRRTPSRDGCIQADERCSPHQGTFDAPLLVGDVTGDGRSDLLIGTTPDWMDVFAGTSAPGIVAPEPIPVALKLPDDGEYVWFADLDGDGRQDIVLHHVSADAPHRVATHFAR